MSPAEGDQVVPGRLLSLDFFRGVTMFLLVAEGTRLFAALSGTAAETVIEAMEAARGHGTVVSYDLNYRSSLWKAIGGLEKAREVNRRIAPLVDVIFLLVIFFLVMIVLSAVGLMVGGVGVVAIMMISVTERTREIGVRKALGARKREILWQFLVEASTLTLIGGAVGMVLGGGIAFGVSQATPLPATVPVWAIVVALGAAAFTGIIFGIYPAARAARLDPVEALRYE